MAGLLGMGFYKMCLDFLNGVDFSTDLFLWKKSARIHIKRMSHNKTKSE